MEAIDIHTHIMPPRLPNYKSQFGYGGFVCLEHHSCGARMLKDDGTFFRDVQENCWNPKSRISDCDRYNISKQVLSTIPVLFNYWARPQDALATSQYINDHMATVVRDHSDRFYALGTLPMQSPQLAVQELERCMLELGLQGVEIGTHINQWNLNAPEVFEVLAACERLGAAVFVHPWDMMGKDRMPDYWLPWLVGMPAETSLAICSMIFGGVFDRLPELRIAFAHGGGSFPGTIGRIEHGFHVRPDLCAVDNKTNPRDYLGRFFIDSIIHDEQAFRYVLGLLGENSIALGSDYPFPLGELEPGTFIRSLSDLPVQTKEKLLAGNAKRWLGVL